MSQPEPTDASRAEPAAPSGVAAAGVRLRFPSPFVMLALAIVVGAAAYVRYQAAQDDMWLDEVWSLVVYAEPASSPLAVLTEPNSNNHHLVTLWMYLCGAQDDWIVYRLPSLVAGIGTVLLAWQVCRRWGEVEGFFAAVLTARSFVLITYASEARGYALAGFFALAAFLALSRHLATRGWPSAVLFGACVLLGFMSHLSSVFFYAGAVAWSVVALARSARSWPDAAVDVLRCQGPAFLLLAIFYVVSLREYYAGGAPPYVLSEVVARTLALAVGGPTEAPLVFAAAAAAALIVVAALVWLAVERNDLWVFFLVTLVVAPGCLLLARPSSLFERFFYVSILFLLVLAGYLLGRVFRWQPAGPYTAVVAAGLFVLCNEAHTRPFLQFGRGQYLAALEHIAANTPGDEIHVASDHDFRNRLLIEYYQRHLDDPRPIRYHTLTRRPPPAVAWVILHDFEPEPLMRRIAYDRYGDEYELRELFRYAGLSGFHWIVYHRTAAPAGPNR